MSGQEPTTDSGVLVLSWPASWMCGGFVDVECAAGGGMGNTAQDFLAGGRDFSKAAIRD